MLQAYRLALEALMLNLQREMVLQLYSSLTIDVIRALSLQLIKGLEDL